MNKEEVIWKQRFERLASEIADLGVIARDREYEGSNRRVFEVAPVIYVSFNLDVCDSEAIAKKLYGEGKYDVYALKSKGDDDE